MIKYPIPDFKEIYKNFSEPINQLDCGQKCAPHHPKRIPFCCDISTAIPAVYQDEWRYLRQNTDLWHVWSDEVSKTKNLEPNLLIKDLPDNMILLACKGVMYCQREYRSLSCRQFPFFPYITDDFRFLGLAYDWIYENQCWVISNLDQVSDKYRSEFVSIFDELFNDWPEEMESYAIKSEEMRLIFHQRRQRISILHRNGKNYLLSPSNERLYLSPISKLRKYQPY